MPLLSLPEDVLFNITLYLSVLDVLRLRQICRALHAFGGNDYLWHRLISRFDLPINIPPNTDLSSIPADVLQQEAIKAIRLELNWRKPISRVVRSRAISKGTRDPYTHMQFLPGGMWLLTAQKYHRMLMTRFTTRMSVWSFADVEGGPRCVFRVELTGTYRSSAMALKPSGNSAILVIGIEDGFHEFLEIRTISLRDDVDSSYARKSSPSPETWKRVELPPFPIRGDRVIQDIEISEDILIVTVAIFGEHHFVTWHILLMNVNFGELLWVDPKCTEEFGLLQVRLQKGKLFLLDQRGSSNHVHVYNVPPSLFEEPPPRPKTSLFLVSRPPEDPALIDLGPLITQHVHYLPIEVQSMADMLHVPRQFKSNISITMFDINGAANLSFWGYAIRYPFDSFANAVPSGRRSFGVWIPCRHATSQQLVELGVTGRRMVWMEHELETGRNRVMKYQMADEDWERGEGEGRQRVDHGYLLPPEPNLPFVLNACNCLAFDEISGRLCLAFYDGTLHVLDFA